MTEALSHVSNSCHNSKKPENQNILVGKHVFLKYVNYAEYMPVDEESGLTISCVAGIISATSFNGLIIEVVCHLGFRVAINKPKEIAVVVLHAILRVMLLPQESANITSNVHLIPAYFIC